MTGSFIPPQPEDLAPLFPNLEILELLGKGGMGAVYKARQPHLDRLVALKILPPEVGEDPAFQERFTREARALAKLNHPNIVAVYDFGQTSSPLSPGGRGAGGEGASAKGNGSLYYFLMEYVDGANIRELIHQGGLKPDEALAIVPQICEALQFAHDEGIVHRDIKPENILVNKKGRVKIADFGLSKLLTGGTDVPPAKDQFTLTGTGQVMGTVHYMAPEQMKGSHGVDHRADIYSLGVVFYEMLTGELPIGKFEPPSKKVQIDVRLDEVVLRSLENEPSRRYQHASDVKTDVETISSSRPAVVPTPTPPPSHPAVDFDPDDVRRAVRAPGDGIIVTALLSFVPAVLIFLGDVMNLVPSGPLERLHDAGVSSFVLGMFVGIPSLLGVPVGLLMIQGALRMQSLTSYRWARIGAILAMLPFTPAWLLGLPMGLWALHVLREPKVRAAFGEPPYPGTSRSHTGPAHPTAETVFSGARQHVRRPAIGLIFTGAVKGLTGVLLVLSHLPVEWHDAREFGTALTITVLGAVIVSGGWLTLRLQNYIAAVVAGGLALLALFTPVIGEIGLGPWALDLISLPVGIWALVILTRPEVRAAFARMQEEGVWTGVGPGTDASAGSLFRSVTGHPAGRLGLLVTALLVGYGIYKLFMPDVSDVLWSVVLVLSLLGFLVDVLRYPGRLKWLQAAFPLLAGLTAPLIYLIANPQPLIDWLYRISRTNPGQDDPTFLRIILGVIAAWLIWQMVQVRKKIAAHQAQARLGGMARPESAKGVGVAGAGATAGSEAPDRRGPGLPFGPAPATPAAGPIEKPVSGEVEQRRYVERIRQELRGPGAALMVIGVMSFVAAVVIVAMSFGLASLYEQLFIRVDYGNRSPELVYTVPIALLCVLFGGLLGFGGRQMQRLKHYELSLLASSISVLPAISTMWWMDADDLFLPAVGCWFAAVPGIWAFLVLIRDDVKTAFRRQQDLTEIDKTAETPEPRVEAAVPESVRRQLRGPAIGLLATSIVECVVLIVGIVFIVSIIGAALVWEYPPPAGSDPIFGRSSTQEALPFDAAATIREIPMTEAERSTPGLTVFRYELNLPPKHHARFTTELRRDGKREQSGIRLIPGPATGGRVELRLQKGGTLSPEGEGKLRWDSRREQQGGTASAGGWIDDPFAGMTGRTSTWRGTEEWELTPEKERPVLILRGWEGENGKVKVSVPAYAGDPAKLAERIRKENAWADVELYLKVQIHRD